MFVRLVTRLFLVFSFAMLASCGGGNPAPAATGLKAVPGESSATISWDMVPGVEYWLFYAPTVLAPADNSNMSRWFSNGGVAVLKVSSPFTVNGLSNDLGYSFTVNGRTDGGPGGPAPTAVTATPRLAGATWTAGTATGTADLRAITYGTQYVAGGVGGVLYTSADGTVWTTINSPTTNTLHSGDYYGDYRMVGNGGVLLSSTDAVTWTQRTTNTTQNLYAIANNGFSLIVAVGANGTIISSSDGTSWTAATNAGTTKDLYSVTYSTYNGGTWLAVGAAGTIVSSVDGLNWTAVASGTTADLRGATYGYTNASATSTVLTTSFVVVGTGGTVLASTDGSTWTSQTLPGGPTLNATRYGNQFIAVGNGGTVFLSKDAATWTAADTAGNTKDLLAVARGSVTYMAVGTAGSNLLAK